MHFTIANHDPYVRVSSMSDCQIRAFNHVSVLAGGAFQHHSAEVKNCFKPLVDEYGTALSKSPQDKYEIFTKMNAIINKVIKYPWDGINEQSFNKENVQYVKNSLFEHTIDALNECGGITVHHKNNAWFIIAYTLREILTLPDVNSVITFKLIPLINNDDDESLPGWVEIDSGTKFSAIYVVQISEATRTVHGRATFHIGDPFNVATWYPIILKVGTSGQHQLYLKPDGQILA
jgi:hypothetical protein